ncbi:aldehyde dehydrogenase family protein [Granulicella paludicola]|uniref:aldehyde dehydrogenase family protein n=1 Tax=Granulicella paludicola TaxID=474951 RepID=UPI0021DFB458|nr:aldehyde dehydrogenase family protein [Granulicella paludicola]
MSCTIASSTKAPVDWGMRTVAERLTVLSRARHLLAQRAVQIADAISPELARTKADTLTTELLPLLDACRFLERNAAKILKPRKLGSAGRPMWLSGIQAEVHREPLGHILIVGPSNFPLFLPGTQTLQALAAGNTVTWKPGSGGGPVAELLAQTLMEAGLPVGALTITDESVAAAQQALAESPDKVVFTGSSHTGQTVLSTLAETATPAVVELSGADAILVTPDADLRLVARAVAFGLRLNGGAVCMSPRRLFASTATMALLRPLLIEALRDVPPVQLNATTSERLRLMIASSIDEGAQLLGDLTPDAQRPVLIDSAKPSMEIARSDIFAPVLSLLAADTMMHIPAMYAQCSYALTLSIFCAKQEMPKARMIARKLKAGTVLVNDIIAPTADPRVPFGGRGASGYGVTRGSEGLLEMTAVKTLILRRNGAMRHLDATTDADLPLFTALIGTLHGGTLSQRWTCLRALISSARNR